MVYPGKLRKSTKNSISADLLPDSVLVDIFKLLADDPSAQHAVSLVCRRFYELEGCCHKFLRIKVWDRPDLRRLFRRFDLLEHLELVDRYHVASRPGDVKEEMRELARPLMQQRLPGAVSEPPLRVCPSGTGSKPRESGQVEEKLEPLEVVGQMCPQLRCLTLKGLQQVSEKACLQVALGCRHLQSVAFRDCSFQEGAMLQISTRCRNLREFTFIPELLLTMRASHILGSNLRIMSEVVALGASMSLEVMRITRCEPEAIVAAVMGSSSLKTIELDSCRLPKILGEALREKCPALSKLLLRACQVADEFLEALGRNSCNLQELCLDMSRYRAGMTATPQGLKTLVKNSPRLHSFDFSCFDMKLLSLTTHLRALKVLKLVLNELVDDEDMAAIGIGCPELRHVELWFCRSITNVGVLALITHCHATLEDLILCGVKLTRDTLEVIGSQCGGLQKLMLGGTRLQDSWLEAAARGCTRLHSLVLMFCHGVTDAALTLFAKHCATLRVVVLSFCPEISTDGVAELVASCRHLKVIKAEARNISPRTRRRAAALGILLIPLDPPNHVVKRLELATL